MKKILAILILLTWSCSTPKTKSNLLISLETLNMKLEVTDKHVVTLLNEHKLQRDINIFSKPEKKLIAQTLIKAQNISKEKYNQSYYLDPRKSDLLKLAIHCYPEINGLKSESKLIYLGDLKELLQKKRRID